MVLLVTRLKTIHNEDITIPNSIILAKEVINYTTSAKDDDRLIVTIPVGLDYNIDVETVDKLLLLSCQNLLYLSKSFLIIVFNINLMLILTTQKTYCSQNLNYIGIFLKISKMQVFRFFHLLILILRIKFNQQQL
jgi:small-conductance mechanosensitive channel